MASAPRPSKDEDGIRFFTRRGHDWTAKYWPLVKEAKAIEAESFIIEGEVIVTNEAGLANFSALKKTRKLSQKEQYERFKEVARELEADESGDSFIRVFERIVRKKPAD